MLKTLLTTAGLLFVIGSSSPASFPFTPYQVAAIDVYRMASVVEAEARGEPTKCQCLAGEVLVNRANGSTIARSALQGFKRAKPSQASIEIARKVLAGTHRHHYLYFFNPDTATDKKWLAKNRKKQKHKCGKYVFFE